MDKEGRYNTPMAKKANALIQASHKFTAYEQKLLLLLIAQQREEDKEIYGYYFSMQDLAKCFDVDLGNLYRALDETTDLLVKKTVSFKDEKMKAFEKGALITWARLKDGILELQINPKFKDLFLELGNQYTLLPLQNMFKLSRSHALRLYELLYQWQGTSDEKGVHWEKIMKIDELREYLGIEENQYQRIFDFRKWVLDDPLEEINAKTDISVTYELIKFGRKFNRIKFIVDREPPYTIKQKGKKKTEKEEHDEYELKIQKLEKKLEKASSKEKARFESILKDIRDQEELFPDSAIKLKPSIKAENDKRQALELWAKKP